VSFIYSLNDPRDNKIRYISFTIKTLKRRLYYHVLATKHEAKSPTGKLQNSFGCLIRIKRYIVLTEKETYHV